MGRGLYRKSLFYCLVFFITSCVTINIYFPAAAVEKAADKIVDEVWGAEEGKEPAQKEQQHEEGAPQSLLEEAIMLAVSVTGPRQAYAQEADINVTTPAIRTLKESIKKRAETIKPFMDSGNVGIGKDGLLVIRNSTGLKLKDKARLKRLIEAENRDRNALYSEIAKANGFPPEKVADIKRIFAGSWIKKARKGWWVQGTDGTWKRK
ncbi:MAG: YdbL family protein [Deferribacteres bacterium]|nr:YdbL family protein [Deferribacteres bacterium]